MIAIPTILFGLLFLFALIGVIAICFIVVFMFKSINKEEKARLYSKNGKYREYDVREDNRL